jgi:hypothetical protein
VKLAARWLRKLTPRRLTFSIQYHADQDLVGLRRYRAEALATDPDAIRLQRKSNSGRLAGRRWRSPLGVLTITVQDTLCAHDCRRGWIDYARAGSRLGRTGRGAVW